MEDALKEFRMSQNYCWKLWRTLRGN